MGLFINSHLQTLNVHKRLTELEKLSEISTGILALKAMVENGDKLQDRTQALENLSRILPLLSANQQQFVLNEIFTPLLNENADLAKHLVQQELDSDESLPTESDEGAISDYEMEFQLTLNRQAHYLDVKQLNRDQRDFRQEQKKEQIREERDRFRAEKTQQKKDKVYSKIDKAWAAIDFSTMSRRTLLQLKQLVYRYSATLGYDHPRLEEARTILKQNR